MALRSIAVRLVLVFFLSVALALHASTQAKNQILFLQFRMKGDTLTLVNSALRSGNLKRQRPHEIRNGLEYSFRSSDGTVLLEGTLSDQSVRRYEYQDPDNPGRIKFKEITFKDVEFTIRAPYQSSMYSLDVYRVRATPSSGTLAKFRKTPLAIFVLPPLTRTP